MNKTLIKRIMNDNNNSSIFYGNLFPYKDRYALFSPYRMYIISNNMYDIPMNTEEDKNDIALDKINYFTKENYDIEVTIDRNDLNDWYKKVRDENYKDFTGNPYLIQTDDIKIAFNSKYLLDLLKAYKTNTIYCKDDLSPCFTSNDIEREDFGMLLPLRHRWEE